MSRVIADVARSDIALLREWCRAREIEDESVVEFLRQVLGHAVGDFFFSRDVYQVELVLAYSVPGPMESHVDRLAAFHLYVVVR